MAELGITLPWFAGELPPTQHRVRWLEIQWEQTPKASNFLPNGADIITNYFILSCACTKLILFSGPVNTLIPNCLLCRNIFLPLFHLSQSSHSLIYSLRQSVWMGLVGHLLSTYYVADTKTGFKTTADCLQESSRGTSWSTDMLTREKLRDKVVEVWAWYFGNIGRGKTRSAWKVSAIILPELYIHLVLLYFLLHAITYGDGHTQLIPKCIDCS